MTNQRILVSIVLVVVLSAVGFSIYKSRNNPSDNIFDNQALVANFEECANAGYPVMESYPRQCRSASGELFVENVVAPNPDPTPPIPPGEIATGYVSGHVTIGPNCPGPEREGQPCVPPPEVYTSREAVVYGSNGTTVKARVRLDREGNYKIALQLGNYFVQISPAGIGLGEKKPITIKSGKTTVVDFDIDTGIR